MKKFIKKIIPSPMRYALGHTRFQPMFKRLHSLSLTGMNYGRGANPNISGEKYAMLYVGQKLASQPELTIFVVGANIGSYSKLLFETLTQHSLRVHAFEPSKEAFRQLKNNLAGTSANCWNFGIGEKAEELTLYSDAEGSGLASIFPRKLDHFHINLNQKEQIRVNSLDSFCQEHGIGHIHFLKLDIEGFELSALKGAKSMIDNDAVDYIQFEFGGCNIDSRTYFQDFYYLLQPKYQLYRIIKNGLYPIQKYRETQEIFITTNYLAERITL